MPIREMVLKDCNAVMEIEALSYADPWTKESFLTVLERQGMSAFVYGHEQKVVAYFILQFDGFEIHIITITVHPEYRRKGIALACMSFMEQFAREKRYLRIYLEVQESNLPAQLLYRKAGYKATRILRNHYPKNHEDAYLMTRDLSEKVPAAQ